MNGRESNWREGISLAGAVILGAVLVIASIGKVLDPVMFVEQIRKEGLEIFFSANTVALIALAIETVLGAALLLGVRTFWVVAPAAGLSAFFVFLTGRSYWWVLSGARDNSYECGCFGVFMQRTVEEAFWQDITVLLIPLAMILVGSTYKSFKLPMGRTIAAFLAGAFICVWAVAIQGMPPAVPDSGSQMASSGLMGAEGIDTFEPTGQYALLVGGQEDPSARILESQVSLRLLIISEKIAAPIVLDIRSNQVLQADQAEVEILEGNGASIPLETELMGIGEFNLGSGGLSFEVNGDPVNLISR